MQYHAPTRQFIVPTSTFHAVSLHLRYAIQHIRRSAGLPLTPHKPEGPLGEAQFAEIALLSAAQEIGIDLGASQPGRLDVSEAP